MFMRKITLLFVALLFGITANAQQMTCSLSEEFNSVASTSEEGLFKFGENTYAVVYYLKNKHLTIQLFDKSLKQLVSQSEIELPEEVKGKRIWQFLKLKENFYLVYFKSSKKPSTLAAYRFDQTNLKFKGAEIILVETNNLDNDLEFERRISNDSSKIMYVHKCKRVKRADGTKVDVVNYNSFNEKLEKLYSSELEMPYASKNTDILNHAIDSRGNMYSVVTTNKLMSTDNPEYTDLKNKDALQFGLLRVNQTNKSLDAIQMNFDGKYVISATLIEDPEKNMNIVGYYSNLSPKGFYRSQMGTFGISRVCGAYIHKVNVDGNEKFKRLLTTHNEFPQEITTDKSVSEKNDKEEDKRELTNIQYRKAIFKEDGSVVIVGERYYYTMSQKNSGTSTVNVYYHHYDDIIAMKIDKAGTTVWCKKIEKKETDTEKESLSFYHYSLGNKECFLYRTSRNSITKDLKKTLPENVSSAGVLLVQASIEGNGEMSTKAFYINELDFKPSIRHLTAISPGVFADRADNGPSTSKILKLEVK
jgi:hypothetical protein